MGVRQRRRRGSCNWMPCAYCKKALAGTDDYRKIPLFQNERELDKHLKVCKYKYNQKGILQIEGEFNMANVHKNVIRKERRI